MKINFILLFLVLLLDSCKNSRVTRQPEIRLSSEVINLGTVNAFPISESSFQLLVTASRYWLFVFKKISACVLLDMLIA